MANRLLPERLQCSLWVQQDPGRRIARVGSVLISVGLIAVMVRWGHFARRGSLFALSSALLDMTLDRPIERTNYSQINIHKS